MFRYRIHYTKGREIQYTGNLDMIRVWERSFRRAGLPLCYSQGFHPQPRLNLAAPLPLGMTSTAELTDCWLEEQINPEELQAQLITCVPPGIRIQAIHPIELTEKALQVMTTSALYEIRFKESRNFDELKHTLDDLLSQDSIVRTRRKKEYDLRPLIRNARLVEVGHTLQHLEVELSAKEGLTGRADEFVDALGIAREDVDIVRTAINLN